MKEKLAILIFILFCMLTNIFSQNSDEQKWKEAAIKDSLRMDSIWKSQRQPEDMQIVSLKNNFENIKLKVSNYNKTILNTGEVIYTPDGKITGYGINADDISITIDNNNRLVLIVSAQEVEGGGNAYVNYISDIKNDGSIIMYASKNKWRTWHFIANNDGNYDILYQGELGNKLYQLNK